jgi:hypothetical protein
MKDFNLTKYLRENVLNKDVKTLKGGKINEAFEGFGGYIDLKPINVNEEIGTAMGEEDIEGAKNDTSNVDRFEVIDHTSNGQGRALVKRGVNVELSFQDDGKTLKVFLTDKSQ